MKSSINKIIPYTGFKGSFAKQISTYIPHHKYYIEPFMGGLGVILNKTPSNYEIINDINNELYNLYDVIKNDYEELRKKWDFILKSRYLFKELKKKKDLDRIELAFKTMYIRYNSLNGNGHSFVSQSKNIVDFDRIKDRIKKTYKRLQYVNIENRDYKDVINMWNKKNSFFYLDPPYFGTDNSGYSSGELNLDEFIDILKSIKGKFILSHTSFTPFDNLFNRVVVGKRSNGNYKTSSNEKVEVKMIDEVIYTNFRIFKQKVLF